MIRLRCLLSLLLVLFGTGTPLLALASEGPLFSVEVNRFRQPGSMAAYVETPLSVEGNSLRYVAGENGFVAAIGVEVVVRSLPDSSPTFFDAFRLSSQPLADTSEQSLDYNLMNQLRIELEPGEYVMRVRVSDLHTPDTAHRQVVREFTIEPIEQKAFATSDILFAEELTPAKDRSDEKPSLRKHGLRIVPHPQGDYFSMEDSLTFYVEFYNLKNLTKQYYFVEAYLTPTNAELKKPSYTRVFKPKKPKAFRAFGASFDIRQLPSQTYYLHINLKLNDGSPLASLSRKFYLHNKPELAEDKDEAALYDLTYGYEEHKLDTFLLAMKYIASDAEKDMIKADLSFAQKKRFFYRFWEKRRQDPEATTGREWFNYLKGIRYANKKFRTISTPGWKSDRGRILLKYGPPNTLEEFHDPLVYEIWSYDRLKNQTGAFFIFSSPERATNTKRLVHSTLRGEAYDPEWQSRIEAWSSPDNTLFKNRPVTLPPVSTGDPTQR